MRQAAIAWLQEQGKESLASRFDERGQATEATAKVWQRGQYENAETFARTLYPVCAAGLGAPRLMADFGHWSKSAYFKLEEALWLSSGLDPDAIYRTKDIRAPAGTGKLHAIDTFVGRRRELLRREFNPNGYETRVSAADLNAWIKRVDFDVHPGFADMLAVKCARDAGAKADRNGSGRELANHSGRTDLRELQSLSKLLVAIAIREYGYRPDDARSPIPKEIEAIADELGLEVSRETILKYLRLGASYLPADWQNDLD
jgi:hypothetical protein